MDPSDDDIEFDFFEDEPATTEAQPGEPRMRLPRRGGTGSGSRRPAGPPRNLTPIVRLLAAITVLVALFVVFGLAIQSCAATSKHDTYATYMSNVAKIAHSSQDDGTAVATALTTAGTKASSLSGTLSGIAEQERQNVAQAQKLDPPGPLRPENQQLIEALELRISGVQGLASAIGQLAASKSTTDAGTLAEQADRLLASDIVWSDLFQAPAAAEMAKQGVRGVAPPPSKFVANRQLVSETTMSGVIQRLKGATTSGGKVTGLHGTNLVSVKAMPGNQVLSQSAENTVTATTSLAFVVTIKDSGDFQEVGIPITLTIQQNPAISRTLRIAVINPGQEKSVTFSNLGTVKFAQKENLLVDVAPVKGEVHVDNNKGTYSVIFSLG
ncbi:MAG TPA: hypothetical protein VFA97_09750 [Gaiellaceae bacterium]|nr:hypothetical protein [Gaiellaceae bacterium]